MLTRSAVTEKRDAVTEKRDRERSRKHPQSRRIEIGQTLSLEARSTIAGYSLAAVFQR